MIRTLGRVEMLVLMTIERLGENAWGKNIVRYLCDCPLMKRQIKDPEIYAILAKLEAQGYLTRSHPPTMPKRAGRQAKLSTLTERGQIVVSAVITNSFLFKEEEIYDWLNEVHDRHRRGWRPGDASAASG